jgi:hypothetical protein
MRQENPGSVYSFLNAWVSGRDVDRDAQRYQEIQVVEIVAGQ